MLENNDLKFEPAIPSWILTSPIHSSRKVFKFFLTSLTCVFILFCSSTNANAAGGIIKALIEAVEQSSKNGAKTTSKVGKLGIAAPQLRHVREQNVVSSILKESGNKTVIFTYHDDTLAVATKISGRVQLKKFDAGLVSSGSDDVVITEAAFSRGLTPERAAIIFRQRQVYLASFKHAPVKMVRATVNDVEKLVVAPKESLTFSLEAWGARGKLSVNYSEDIFSQSRIIVFSDNPTTKAYFQSNFGSRAMIVSDPTSLTRALNQSKRQFVVVVGHVEEGSFVLREGGEVLVKRNLDEMMVQLDKRRSSSLMLGCDIGCKTAFSGPTRPVSMRDIPDPLMSALKSRNEANFLNKLTDTFAPIHLEKDLFSNLVAVKASRPFSRNKMVVGGVVTYGVFGGQRDRLSPSEKAAIVAKLPFMMVAGSLMAVVMGPFYWIFAILFGPKNVWVKTKQVYGEFLEVPELDTFKLGRIEAILLCIVAPGIWYLRLSYSVLVFPFKFSGSKLKGFSEKKSVNSTLKWMHLDRSQGLKGTSYTHLVVILSLTFLLSHLISSWVFESLPLEFAVFNESSLLFIVYGVILMLCWVEFTRGRGLLLRITNFLIGWVKLTRDIPFYMIKGVQYICCSLRLSHVRR